MFTGLIEEIGTVSGIFQGRNSYEFKIDAQTILSETKIGDSICTNGACLTVTKMGNTNFTVDIMSETVDKTNFSLLKIGSKVNLERAMRLSDRLGGHLVSGHIDGIGKIIGLEKDDIAWRINIEADQEVISKMIDKGSITIDGISLTIVEVFASSFQVSIIPHTAKETTLLTKKINDTVNLETDMIGKYVLKFLSPSQNTNEGKSQSKVNMNFLQENGFI